MAKATAHGLTRGVITAAQGGKFGAGFASGFVSSGFAVGKDTFEGLRGAAVAARTAVMAVVGGATSEITGGKFANGAITGAFVHLFNHENLGAKIMKDSKYYDEEHMEEAGKYYSHEARMERGEVLYKELQGYSKPLMVAGGAGIAGIALAPIAEAGYIYVLANPETVLITSGVIKTLDGYYGGSAQGFNWGSFTSGLKNSISYWSQP